MMFQLWIDHQKVAQPMEWLEAVTWLVILMNVFRGMGYEIELVADGLDNSYKAV